VEAARGRDGGGVGEIGRIDWRPGQQILGYRNVLELSATVQSLRGEKMNNALVRDRLHKQIDHLPDELVEQVANFTLFLTAKQKAAPRYEDWSEQQWQEFALQQFFREETDAEHDEVEYTLKDAREVYHP
jgi:hypothetical protein